MEYMDPLRSSDVDQGEFHQLQIRSTYLSLPLCSFCSLMFCRFLLKFIFENCIDFVSI